MSSSLCSYLPCQQPGFGTLRPFPATALANYQHFFSRPDHEFAFRQSLWLERIIWLTISLLKVIPIVALDRFCDFMDTGVTLLAIFFGLCVGELLLF